VASARIFQRAGFPAIGTTSAGIAASHGCPDGERLSLIDVLETVRRIASAVDLPVTADMESGFGDVQQMAAAVITAGAAGINIEDLAENDRRKLAETGAQVDRIRAARAVAESAGVPLVINARTDVYLAEIGDPSDRFEHTVERANAYRKAGADCVFVPGVRDRDTIARLVQAIDGPINILAVPGAPAVSELERLGVRRVSVGSGPMRATMALTARIAQELLQQGTYESFAGAIPYAEVNSMFEERK
jgi:2-methylisocitrate lyase-like PEP mutase family enzyme